MAKSKSSSEISKEVEKELESQEVMDEEHDEMHETDKHMDGKPLQKNKGKSEENHHGKCMGK